MVCIKCFGSGKLPQFLHYKGGTCFCCSGTGQLTTTGVNYSGKLTPDVVRRADWIRRATTEDYQELRWGEIVKIRGFVHSSTVAENLPLLLDRYFDVGEVVFQKMQKVKDREFQAQFV